MKLLRVSEVLWEGYVRTETTLFEGVESVARATSVGA